MRQCALVTTTGTNYYFGASAHTFGPDPFVTCVITVESHADTTCSSLTNTGTSGNFAPATGGSFAIGSGTFLVALGTQSLRFDIRCSEPDPSGDGVFTGHLDDAFAIPCTADDKVPAVTVPWPVEVVQTLCN